MSETVQVPFERFQEYEKILGDAIKQKEYLRCLEAVAEVAREVPECQFDECVGVDESHRYQCLICRYRTRLMPVLAVLDSLPPTPNTPC